MASSSSGSMREPLRACWNQRNYALPRAHGLKGHPTPAQAQVLEVKVEVEDMAARGTPQRVKKPLLVATTLGTMKSTVPFPCIKKQHCVWEKELGLHNYNHQDPATPFPFSVDGAFEVASSVVKLDTLSDSEFTSSNSDGAVVEAPSSEAMSEAASEAMLDGSDCSGISDCD